MQKKKATGNLHCFVPSWLYLWKVAVTKGLTLRIFSLYSSRAVQKNSDLLPSTPWSNILFNDFWGTPLTHSGSHKSYRPICVASFRINYYFEGLNPRGFHIVNIVLHGAVSCLVVLLAYQLLGHSRHLPSLVTGTFFAVHPIHTGINRYVMYIIIVVINCSFERDSMDRNKSDTWHFPWYSSRKHCITNLSHAFRYIEDITR